MFGAVWSSDSGFDQGKHAVCGPFWLGFQIRVSIRASTTIRAGTVPVLLFDWRIANEGEKLGMRGKGL